MMGLRDLINIGTDGLQGKEVSTVRLVNLLASITVFVSMMYLVFYITASAWVAIFFNYAVTVCYGLTFLLNHQQRYRSAKFWLFCVYMAHLFVLTAFVFTKDTGFHYYYLAVPPSVFLVFEYKNITDKLFLSLISIFLFYVCEIHVFPEPNIMLSETVNQVLFLSSIFAFFIGILFVIIMFTYEIRKNETAREELIVQLKNALNEIKQLRGILPICAHCKKIRDDKGYWNQIESYIENHTEAEFSHGICPGCAEKFYPDLDLYDSRKAG
ncbi:MAG: hypothetical protein PF482_14635 [Desulfobacteraceae bacterium]|jgi:hypothetical protein|nr:hypothetical protein [Desulfobacteraceae bacterium]